MGMSTGGAGGVKAEPNVTPMIVIPQISAGFTAQPPEGANLKPHPEEDTDQVLGIDNQGRYYLNRTPIPKDQLAAKLSSVFKAPGREEFIMYVKADRGLDYVKVTEALDIAAANGVRMSGLITEQQQGTESIVEPPGGQ